MSKAWIGLAGAAGMLVAAPASAGLTGYLKIPDIDGESQADGVETEDIGFKAADGSAEGDSGEAHLDYLVITMERAQATDSKHTDWISVEGVAWGRGAAQVKAPRDAASGMPTGKRQHKPLIAAKPAEAASTSGGAGAGKASFKELSVTKKTDTSSPAAASTGGAAGAGKVKFDRVRSNKMSTRQVAFKQTYLPQRGATGAGWVKLPAALPGCKVGARYPHAVVGDDEDGEVKLLGVQVAQCSKEHVTLNYEKVKWSD